VTDPRKFKALYNPKERIWQEADRLRAAHPAGRSLPVKVIDLAEFDLGLDLVPADGLREQLDIEALLMGDLRSILVDRHAFPPSLSTARQAALYCGKRFGLVERIWSSAAFASGNSGVSRSASR